MAEGELVVVLESMKMESYVYAPQAGLVTEVFVEDSANVNPGMKLLHIESSDSSAQTKSAERA